MLAVQTISVTCLFLWGLIATYPILWIVNKLIPIRLSPEDEILGCDVVEHSMSDEAEKTLPLLDKAQMMSQAQMLNNAQMFNRFNAPQVTFNIASGPYKRHNSLKEFDTVTLRAPYHINSGLDRDENVASSQTNSRL